VKTSPFASRPGPIVPARRWFLERLGIGSAAVGAFLGTALPAHAQSPPSTPRRHTADDWMDTLPTAHRTVFDATSAEGADDIRRYASNVFLANRAGYGLESRDVGILIILRHYATPYGYNDAMWAKYGSVFVSEPKNAGARAPTANPGNAGGETLDSLSAQGVHFGVCQMATRRYSGMIARSTGGNADAIFEELGKNLVRNAHLTPAGIVAVGRAQERGFTFGYGG
jgi:intracellular sulfur oxidation DsrE/DsrF family protein